MARLLPSRTDPSIDRSEDPSVLYVDSNETEEMLSTLASETALDIFRTLNDEPLTASEIADRRDTTVQNASYHLENLQEVDLIEVVDTCYSEKGREMNIYAVTTDPKVVILGTRSDRGNLRRAFGQMAAAIGAPAIFLAVWRSIAGAAERLLEA
ncbi:MAG: helix-turn-helix domain-containing protein [Natronomonas sp.]